MGDIGRIDFSLLIPENDSYVYGWYFLSGPLKYMAINIVTISFLLFAHTNIIVTLN